MARFSGEGYIHYDLSTLNPPPSTTEDLIKLRFKASNQNGVLLYADGNQGDFVALQLHRGNLLFSIDLGKSNFLLNPPYTYYCLFLQAIEIPNESTYRRIFFLGKRKKQLGYHKIRVHIQCYKNADMKPFSERQDDVLHSTLQKIHSQDKKIV